MHALTQHPEVRASTARQLEVEHHWDPADERLLNRIAQVVACALCMTKIPQAAQAMLTDITDEDLKLATVREVRHAHEEVADLILGCESAATEEGDLE